MLGEIIKSSEALRYHAKTAEIAGQNLAHVNDESYARQRVLAREGLMFKGQNGLQTSSLEGSGLDHARNELLDKRVLAEFGDTASLESQIEILKLLQSALGESIDRSGLDGGLDLEQDSNLADGGLSRALDDLFNAFQELSSSPDEATAKQEVFQKIQTLTKRFNDAGNAINSIESDLSLKVDSAVSEVNRLLNQIYEVNVQIKRFELLGQGKAVTYRDNRQKLLEDLSKLMNFKVDPELSADGLSETGFWNLTALGTSGNEVEILSSLNGVVPISKDFGNIFEIANEENGKSAKIKSKISSDGTLGFIEVIDGGSEYDDTKGPILVSFAPSQNIDGAGDNKATLGYNKGEVFLQDNQLYQALQTTLAGAVLSDESNFLKVDSQSLPRDGEAFPESLRRYSDLETFKKGEMVFYEGKLYQASADFGPSYNLGFQDNNPLAISKDLTKGEVVKLKGNYFQALASVKSGTEIQGLDAASFVAGDQIDGKLLALGTTPPTRVDDLSYIVGSITDTESDRWFLGKSYQQGDLVKFEDKYFEVTNDIYRNNEISELANILQTNDPYEIGQQFGSFKAIENPSPDFATQNEAIYIASNKREFSLLDFKGSSQAKEVTIENIPEIYEFSLSLNGEELILSSAKEGSFVDQVNAIKDDIGVEKFIVTEDVDGKITISGKRNISDDFEITEQGPELSAQITTISEAQIDKFSFTIDEVGDRFTEGGTTPLSVDFEVEYQGDADSTALALVDEINNNAELKNIVQAKVINGGVSIVSNSTVGSEYDLELLFRPDDFNPEDEIETATTVINTKIVDIGNDEIIQAVVSKSTSLEFVQQEADFLQGQDDAFIRFKQNDIYHNGNEHFVVTAPLDVPLDQLVYDAAGNFDVTDPRWADNFKSFEAELIDPADRSQFIRKSYPTGLNLENGNLIELNIGLGEAVVKGGSIVGFNILNKGNNLPLADSIFANGQEIQLESGSIAGYQKSRAVDVENYRLKLNDLVSEFVEEINAVYNPDDQPGNYLFGFDAILTRPIAGRNLLMEEEFGLVGREGDAYLTLYRDEVDMTLPYAGEESFSVVNTTPIYSEDFRGMSTVNMFRGGDVAETTFRAENAGDLFSFYGSASRMDFVTMENDDSYPGADLSPGTADDGRSLMMAYETIPFRIEGLEDGSKLPIIGDNFTFSALPSNPWNLASSLKVDRRLSSESLLSGSSGASGSNEIAQAITELGDGSFINKVAMINGELGTGIGDLSDNLEHQKSIENLLLDQRRAVSSVSIDEEVADLMRFQRSFQASSRVLTTLDKMLEIIVMGLVR
jgi:flagellar hook-associated protein FlgK